MTRRAFAPKIVSMKQSRFYPLLAVGCLAVSSCGLVSSINQPISGGYDPLDSPGSGTAATEAVEETGPTYAPGQWLETTVPSAALYSRVPRRGDQPYRTLGIGTPLRVLSTEGTYVRVELASGGIARSRFRRSRVRPGRMSLRSKAPGGEGRSRGSGGAGRPGA